MTMLKEYGFRAIVDKYVYIAAKNLAFVKNYFEGDVEANGILVYCYLDHEQGLQLEVLCQAFFDSEKRSIKLFAANAEASIGLPYGMFGGCEALVLPDASVPVERFTAKVEAIKAKPVSEEVLKGRSIAALDAWRSEDNPDEVLVHLARGNEEMDTCYVRLEKVGSMDLTGILLSEPKIDFGVHEGELLQFFLVKNEMGVMCMAIRQ